MSKQTNILFVCKHNRFRSIFAEAFFKKYNQNKGISVKSAGPIRGSPISKEVKTLAKKYGLKTKKAPKGLSSSLMVWTDVIIIVADDVPKSLFSKSRKQGKKIISFKIPDTESNKLEEMEKIVKMIDGKVKKLTENLR